MSKEFPYQLVAFLDREPEIGEPVYEGPNGWYAQIALKRRFKVQDINEDELIKKIKSYCSSVTPLVIHTGDLINVDHMPVKILEVEQTDELMSFHRNFIQTLGRNIISRYPERDGANYYPHITAEYNDRMVIDTDIYINKRFKLEAIWLLKDIDSEDSTAYTKFTYSI